MPDVAERLARELAGGVGRDGRKNRVVLAEGNLRVHAIDGRRRRDGDFFDTMFSRGFEEIDRALHVDALVKRRFGQARTHARARGEVDDLVELDRGKNLGERGGIGEIAVDEFKRLGERLDVAEVAAFELRVVGSVEVVERPDRVAVVQEPFANMRADEAGAAGDQKIHARKLIISGRGVERQALAFWPQLPSARPRNDKSSSKSGQCRPNGDISIRFNCWCVPCASRGLAATGKRISAPLSMRTTICPFTCAAVTAMSVKVFMFYSRCQRRCSFVPNFKYLISSFNLSAYEKLPVFPLNRSILTNTTKVFPFVLVFIPVTQKALRPQTPEIVSGIFVFGFNSSLY